MARVLGLGWAAVNALLYWDSAKSAGEAEQLYFGRVGKEYDYAVA